MNVFSKTVFMVVIAIFVVSGCAKEKFTFKLPKEEIPSDQQLVFDLVILDHNWEKTNKLKQGESFFIAVEVSNRSGDTVVYSKSYGENLFMKFYKTRDFMSIFRKGAGNQTSAYIGKPYDPELNYAIPLINLPDRLLNIPPSGQYITLAHSWLDYAPNKPLPRGSYLSAFGGKFEIGVSEIVVNTSIEFDVN